MSRECKVSLPLSLAGRTTWRRATSSARTSTATSITRTTSTSTVSQSFERFRTNGSGGQSFSSRKRVVLFLEINRNQKHFGFCSFGRRRNWTKMFLHFGYFLRKGVFLQKASFLQKYSLSAEMLLYFCRRLSAFGLSAERLVSAETYRAESFLQKYSCISAER